MIVDIANLYPSTRMNMKTIFQNVHETCSNDQQVSTGAKNGGPQIFLYERDHDSRTFHKENAGTLEMLKYKR